MADRHGIVHAEYEPANIMLMPREVRHVTGTRCKILDFGLAIDLTHPPNVPAWSGRGNIAGALTLYGS